jgi:class 3 adenylate cyclase
MTPAAPAAALEGTVVFTDLVGFTEYTALRGDEEALALLSVQERLVREALPQNARVVKELGDGLLLWFPDACEAIKTALKLQQRFEEESEASELPLWVRCGMHTGRQMRRGFALGCHVGEGRRAAARRLVRGARPGGDEGHSGAGPALPGGAGLDSSLGSRHYFQCWGETPSMVAGTDVQHR